MNSSALHAPAGDPEEPHSAIQHFHDKLVHIKDRLKTSYGRQLGERRHRVVGATLPSNANRVTLCSSSLIFWRIFKKNTREGYPSEFFRSNIPLLDRSYR